jgi:hypothetical protein
MSKKAKPGETLSQSDLVTIAEFLKFIRAESPNAELDVLELLDVSDEEWNTVLSRLNNAIKE